VDSVERLVDYTGRKRPRFTVHTTQASSLATAPSLPNCRGSLTTNHQPLSVDLPVAANRSYLIPDFMDQSRCWSEGTHNGQPRMASSGFYLAVLGVSVRLEHGIPRLWDSGPRHSADLEPAQSDEHALAGGESDENRVSAP